MSACDTNCNLLILQHQLLSVGVLVIIIICVLLVIAAGVWRRK